jgi:hypothetical protein
VWGWRAPGEPSRLGRGDPACLFKLKAQRKLRIKIRKIKITIRNAVFTRFSRFYS